jgi:hypothetical protein
VNGSNGAGIAKNAITRRYTDYRVAKLALFIAFVGNRFPSVLPNKKTFWEALFPSDGQLGDARTRWTCNLANFYPFCGEFVGAVRP